MGFFSLITLTDAEVQELWRYMLNSYLDVNTYPALRQLLNRIGAHQKHEALTSHHAAPH